MPITSTTLLRQATQLRKLAAQLEASAATADVINRDPFLARLLKMPPPPSHPLPAIPSPRRIRQKRGSMRERVTMLLTNVGRPMKLIEICQRLRAEGGVSSVREDTVAKLLQTNRGGFRRLSRGIYDLADRVQSPVPLTPGMTAAATSISGKSAVKPESARKPAAKRAKSKSRAKSKARKLRR